MVATSPTKPGVKGPMAIPASMYPTSVGSPMRRASVPPKKATTRATAMLMSSGNSCMKPPLKLKRAASKNAKTGVSEPAHAIEKIKA